MPFFSKKKEKRENIHIVGQSHIAIYGQGESRSDIIHMQTT